MCSVPWFRIRNGVCSSPVSPSSPLRKPRHPPLSGACPWVILSLIYQGTPDPKPGLSFSSWSIFSRCRKRLRFAPKAPRKEEKNNKKGESFAEEARQETWLLSCSHEFVCAQHCWTDPLTAPGTGVPRGQGGVTPMTLRDTEKPSRALSAAPMPSFSWCRQWRRFAGLGWGVLGAHPGTVGCRQISGAVLHPSSALPGASPGSVHSDAHSSVSTVPPGCHLPGLGHAALPGAHRLFAAFCEATAPRGRRSTPVALPTSMAGCLHALMAPGTRGLCPAPV